MTRFTAGELEVMRVLWQHGELKPAAIVAAFPRKIKNPALRSVLGVLLDKGHVRRHQVGKAFFYKAVTPRESALHERLRDLADQFFEGSMRTLLFNLVESETLSDADAAELHRLAKTNININAKTPVTNKSQNRKSGRKNENREK